MMIYGLDFTSVPSHKKPITCVRCRLDRDGLHLESCDTLPSFDVFESFLAQPGPWVAGLDFPFGQPRKLVENMGWPNTWEGAKAFIQDGSGDALDALLCAIQAGWAYSQPNQHFGIPADCDLLEGWIVDPGLALEI